MSARVLIAAALFAALCASCAEPASLRVTIDVRERGLEALRIAVARDNDNPDKSLLACTFPAGRSAEPGCLLEGGSAEWKGDREPLTFVLYGRPGTDLVVGAAGLRSVDAISVATSTEAFVSLPKGDGEEAEVELVLVARTSVHSSCSEEVGVGGNDRSGLSVFDVFPGDQRPEILASTGGSFAVLKYSPVAETCDLDVPDNFPAQQTCPILEHSLIVTRAPVISGALMASLCAATETQLRFAGFSGNGEIAAGAATSTIARTNFSRPVFADLNGDERPEIFMLRAQRPLALATWRTGTEIVNTLVKIPEMLPNNLTNPQMQVAPLVVHDPRTQRDSLIIAGYHGGMSVVSGGGGAAAELKVTHPLEDVGNGTLAPAAVVLEEENYLHVYVVMMHGLELRVTELEGRDDEWNLIEQFPIAAPQDITAQTDRDVRLAIGDIDGSGQLVAVTVQNGKAFIYPLRKGAAVRTMDIWEGVTGVQSVLLANLDGMPGAEIIAFDADSPNIHAVTATGQELDGWPLLGPEGGNTRVALAELDPPNAPIKNTEVIALSQRTVKVFSLGPGSYDPNDPPPWPMRDHDSAGRAVLRLPR